MCRSALEQGLKCSPNHWPCIENLIAVTYKLGDYLACLGYCITALERDPTSEKAVLYKSKVYNEMPFLQELYSDTEFVPQPTEVETFHKEMEKGPIRKPLSFEISELTLECLASSLFLLSEQCDHEWTPSNPIDTANSVSRLHDKLRLEEDSKIQVSVQNLVDEIIDIIEEEEEIESFVEDILDELLCNIFSVEPKTFAEKVSIQILNEIVANVVKNDKNMKKKSVTIEPKARERKKGNALDEIPDELIEKRRSSRKARVVESMISSDLSSDQERV